MFRMSCTSVCSIYHWQLYSKNVDVYNIMYVYFEVLFNFKYFQLNQWVFCCHSYTIGMYIRMLYSLILLAMAHVMQRLP